MNLNISCDQHEEAAAALISSRATVQDKKEERTNHRRRHLRLGLKLALVFSFILCGSNWALATTRWVNNDGSPLVPPPGMNCSKPGYATIQAAVNDANPGDRINVCKGTYPEQVTIAGTTKNNIQLRSVGAWQAVIQAP